MKKIIFAFLLSATLSNCKSGCNGTHTNTDASDSAGTVKDAEVSVGGTSSSDGSSTSVCPQDMVFVQSHFCKNLEHTCDTWLDPPSAIVRRCASYKRDSKCLSKERDVLKFCIDKYEYSNSSDNLPLNNVSWTESKQLCELNNRRLCTTSEWTAACEGEEQFPYPYGYDRDASKCNIDQLELLSGGTFLDLRKPVMDFKQCTSSFGAQNMTGNIDEWVMDPNRQPPTRSILMGGWWGPLRNRCRAMTGGHNEHFIEVSAGFRCCKDV
jgi:formylglycine-generating enzyme